MKNRWPKIKEWILNYYSDLIVIAIVSSVLLIVVYRFIAPPFTILMINRSLSSFDKELHYRWVDFEDMSESIKVCAMASEDQNLPFHFGFDLVAISKAIDVNSRSKKTFGASTITQQVAKNVFLFPQRSIIRKALEVYFTFWIEVLWPKERILEMYLNVAEMGDMIFGIEAASREYFKKPASKLSLNEAALIISILPNPRKYNVKAPGPYVQRRQKQIISLFYSLDGSNYLRELYLKSEKPLYNFNKY